MWETLFQPSRASRSVSPASARHVCCAGVIHAGCCKDGGSSERRALTRCASPPPGGRLLRHLHRATHFGDPPVPPLAVHVALVPSEPHLARPERQRVRRPLRRAHVSRARVRAARGQLSCGLLTGSSCSRRTRDFRSSSSTTTAWAPSAAPRSPARSSPTRTRPRLKAARPRSVPLSAVRDFGYTELKLLLTHNGRQAATASRTAARRPSRTHSQHSARSSKCACRRTESAWRASRRSSRAFARTRISRRSTCRTTRRPSVARAPSPPACPRTLHRLSRPAP